MTNEEARRAVADKRIIQWIDEKDLWGMPTCLSDDETTIYYNPRGCRPRLGAPIEKMEFGVNGGNALIWPPN